MILFQKIKWKNLLSTGAHFTEIDFTKSNNTLIIGHNGAGKSTILDALCFGLFGKPFRKINKPQLLNSVNNKEAVIEVHFNIGQKKYKVIRGIKPNVFEIYLNDVLLNQDAAAKDYQEILENNIQNAMKIKFKLILLLKIQPYKSSVKEGWLQSRQPLLFSHWTYLANQPTYLSES